MSLDSFKTEKDDLEKKLVTTIIDAYRNNQIDYFEMKEAAQYILETIDKANTQENLVTMLQKLSSMSPVFQNILLTESEGDVKQREKAVIDRLSSYIKNYPQAQ